MFSQKMGYTNFGVGHIICLGSMEVSSEEKKGKPANFLTLPYRSITGSIKSPFDPQTEQLFEWYFEDYLEFPFVDTVKAEKAAYAIKLKTIGRGISEYKLQPHIQMNAQKENLKMNQDLQF